MFRQAERRGKWKGGAYYGFFALIALAVLSKGPVGALIPLMAASAFLLSTGRKSELPRLFSPVGVAIVSAIALPWYAAAWAKGGDLFFTTQLVRENLVHFFRGQEGARPFYFFVPGFLVEAGPWSLLFPFAAWQAWKKRRQPTLETLCLWWWLTSFAFFSLAAGKRRVYLLPTMPAVAILVAAWLDSERHWRAWKPRTRLAAALATFLLLFSICAWTLGSLVDWWPGMGLLARLGEEVWRTTLGPLSDALAHHPYLMAASALGVALSGAMVAYSAGSGQQRRLLISVLGFLCFFTALPKVMKWESYKRERAVKSFALASGGIVGEQPLHYFRTGEISQAFFYLGRHVPRATCEFDPRGLAACPPGYYFIDTRVWKQLPAKQRGKATVVLRSAGMDGAVRREDLLLLTIDGKRAPS